MCDIVNLERHKKACFPRLAFTSRYCARVIEVACKSGTTSVCGRCAYSNGFVDELFATTEAWPRLCAMCTSFSDFRTAKAVSVIRII